MIGLNAGQVIALSEDDRKERLLWLDPEGRGAWFIDIDDDSAAPICRGWREVDELLNEGLLKPCDDPWLASGAALTATQETRRDEAWEAIRPIALAQPESFDPRRRAEMIRTRVAEIGISR